MRVINPTTLAALLSLGSIQVSAQIRPLNYETPAFIDAEAVAITVADGESHARIPLHRSGEFRFPSMIEYRTVPLDAEEGADYRGTGGSVLFDGGEAFKLLSIEIIPDPDRKSSKSFQVELTSVHASTIILRDTITVTIEPSLRPLSDQPTLEIIPGPENTIILAWEGSSNFVLERSSDPGAGAWEEFVCEKSVRQDRCEVTQPLQGQFYAFRLRSP